MSHSPRRGLSISGITREPSSPNRVRLLTPDSTEEEPYSENGAGKSSTPTERGCEAVIQGSASKDSFSKTEREEPGLVIRALNQGRNISMQIRQLDQPHGAHRRVLALAVWGGEGVGPDSMIYSDPALQLPCTSLYIQEEPGSSPANLPPRS